MVRYGIWVDPDRCFACYGCEVACKVGHDLPLGVKFLRLVTYGPEEIDGKLHMVTIPVMCMHCSKAPCMSVCPVKGAITQRPDGIVLFEEKMCIGCKMCIFICPYGAPQFNEQKGVVQKCDMCFERVDQGKVPVCVQSCLGKALRFGEVNELTKLIKEKYIKKYGMAGKNALAYLFKS